MKQETILRAAFRELRDPGTPSPSFDAACAVLALDPRWVGSRLEEDPQAVLADLGPDRLSCLTNLLPLPRLSLLPSCQEACLTAFATARGGSASGLDQPVNIPGLWPVRRAHALAELASKLGCFARLSVADLLWLFAWDEYADPTFYDDLDGWCQARDPLPVAVAELVRDLRADEDNSPILDRLAAWVVPSVEGMLDLAGWEAAGRWDPPWKEATERWARGESATESDAAVLAESLDPERSASAAALELAQQRHGSIAHLLREARATTDRPTVRVLLSAWHVTFGGVS